MTTLSERLAALTGPVRDPQLLTDITDLLWARTGDCMFPWYDSAGLRVMHAPRWTSDLSAVVAEIERRGWSWYITRQQDAEAAVYHAEPDGFVRAATACLALLRALLAAVESADAG